MCIKYKILIIVVRKSFGLYYFFKYELFFNKILYYIYVLNKKLYYYEFVWRYKVDI